MKKMLGKLLIIVGIFVFFVVVVKDVFVVGLGFVNGIEVDLVSVVLWDIDSVVIELDNKDV